MRRNRVALAVRTPDESIHAKDNTNVERHSNKNETTSDVTW